MPTDTSLQIELLFQRLNRVGSSSAIPDAGTLSSLLNNKVDRATSDSENLSSTEISYFATAAVEMWHRGLHSYLVSASLTKASPIWCSIAAYYSSHYTVRAFAHLLGHFQLYKKKRNIRLELDGRSFTCRIVRKGSDDREHKFYWKIVKQHPYFRNDPFFTINDDNLDESDGAHRNKANYYDHINSFPNFQILDLTYLTQRLTAISRMVVNDAPIPNRDAYPDIDSVQLIAYYRLIKFRSFLDEILGASHRFWSVHRRPSWCSAYINFQAGNAEYTSVYREPLI